MHKVNQITPMEYAVMQYRAVIPHGTTLEAILKPEAWSHVAREMRPGQFVHAFAEDGTWYAWLYVRNASRIEADLAVVHHIEFDKARDIDPGADTYEAVWVSPSAKWGVKRTSDGEIVMREIATKDEAIQKAKNYAIAQAA